MAFRPEYVATLELLARALALYEAEEHRRPVIVGGAAVEYYTGGEIESGDVDVVEADLAPLAKALEAVGFRREDRSGRLLRGFYHPSLQTGVEVVSGMLFDGRTDRSRLGIVLFGEAALRFAPVEDMIADRLSQYEASRRRDDEMLAQARCLHRLAEHLDQQYLMKRIAEEGGDPDLLVGGSNEGAT